MQLERPQLTAYEDDGLLLLTGLFSPAEIAVLRCELGREFAVESERRVLEKGGGVVRSVYGSHLHNEVFLRLARHPRLVGPARQLLGGEVYVYQFKINAKAAFGGDVWEWHQDFVFWREEDGLPQPALTSAVVFLDPVTEFNGPLLLVAGSHKEGVIASSVLDDVPAEYADSPSWISNLTATLKYSLSRETLSRLVERNPIVAPKGPSGSVLYFHPNIVHGSATNMSPDDRSIVIVTYCRTDNVPAPGRVRRPDFLVSRCYDPIAPLADDALRGEPVQG
jgi:ectoine hydroxylase-related dioxygenase (phytanoyl-CoA dioxygenase family)